MLPCRKPLPAALIAHFVRMDFTAKPGVRYQPQRSLTLTNWSNVGAQIVIPMTNPTVDVATNFVQSQLQQGSVIPSAFYRVQVLY